MRQNCISVINLSRFKYGIHYLIILLGASGLENYTKACCENAEPDSSNHNSLVGCASLLEEEEICFIRYKFVSVFSST